MAESASASVVDIQKTTLTAAWNTTQSEPVATQKSPAMSEAKKKADRRSNYPRKLDLTISTQ